MRLCAPPLCLCYVLSMRLCYAPLRPHAPRAGLSSASPCASPLLLSATKRASKESADATLAGDGAALGVGRIPGGYPGGLSRGAIFSLTDGAPFATFGLEPGLEAD